MWAKAEQTPRRMAPCSPVLAGAYLRAALMRPTSISPPTYQLKSGEDVIY